MPRDVPKYMGIRMPDGSVPPGIMSNGSRARDAENVRMNDATYRMYLWRALDLAMSVFEWKNLPEGIDARMLEYWLVLNGFCVFFHDDDLKYSSDRNAAPEGYAVLQAFLRGDFSIYNLPKERTAYAVNGLNVDLDETNSVIIFNDYLRAPMYPTLELFAKRLAEIDRTIDVNVMAQKTPKVIRCTPQQRLTFENLCMQVQGNVYYIMADKNVDLKDIDVLDTSSPYVGNELQILKHQYWNELLTFLGVENVTTEKKERLVSNEVMSNMGDVEAQRFTRLNARKQACKEINRMLDEQGWFDEEELDDETGEMKPVHEPVDCDFRSGIYIKADGYGSQNIATTGMKDGTVPTEQGTGYSQDSGTVGLIAKIKQLLGMGGTVE